MGTRGLRPPRARAALRKHGRHHGDAMVVSGIDVAARKLSPIYDEVIRVNARASSAGVDGRAHGRQAIRLL